MTLASRIIPRLPAASMRPSLSTGSKPSSVSTMVGQRSLFHNTPSTCHRQPINTMATSTITPRSSPRATIASFSRFHSSTSAQSSSKESSTSQKRPESRPCWKCSQPVPFMALICMNPDCKVVQTVAPGANYYEVLGSEPSFDISVKDLRNRFLRIQQQVHPDSFTRNENGDQAYAQQQSTLANKAYATLKEPLPRANYLLELLGAPIHETESLNESELLMEVMEARELLEEAQTEDEVQELKNTNDVRIDETVKGLSKAFQEGNLDSAKTLAIQLQYWIRIQNVIRDWAAGKPIVADHV